MSLDNVVTIQGQIIVDVTFHAPLFGGVLVDNTENNPAQFVFEADTAIRLFVPPPR